MFDERPKQDRVHSLTSKTMNAWRRQLCRCITFVARNVTPSDKGARIHRTSVSTPAYTRAAITLLAIHGPLRPARRNAHGPFGRAIHAPHVAAASQLRRGCQSFPRP